MVRSITIGILKLCVLVAWNGFASTDGDEMIDVLEEENATLECHFNSALYSMEYSLYWIRTNRDGKDNVVILDKTLEESYSIDYRPLEGLYNLHIRKATYARDNGKFECRMKEIGTGKELHTKTFQLTILLEPGKPRIEPQMLDTVEGRPTELTCSSIGGNPDPQIKWYKGKSPQALNAIYQAGGRKEVESQSVLTLTLNKEDDGSEYRCVVWSRALKQKKSLEAQIIANVNYYPRVKAGPEHPLRIEAKTEAKLDCYVDAKPPVQNVHWMHNGQFLGTNFSHTIVSVSPRDAGVYECIADNGLGQLGKAHVTLDVLHGPRVSVEEIREIDEGQDLRIRCEIISNPPVSLVEWRREKDESFKQIGSLLSLSRVSASDARKYICYATITLQPYGSPPVERTANASMLLRVRHAPGKAFITRNLNHVIEGESTVLSCHSQPPGWPEPSYKWWRKGSDAVIAVGREFTISVTHLNNEGVYYCQGSNTLGKGTPGSHQVDVMLPPRLTGRLLPHVIRRAGDEDFSISCSAKGKPEPTVKWFKNGVEIVSEDNMYEIISESSSGKFFNVQSTMNFRGTMRKDNLLPSDRGNYTCRFENEIQQTESTMLLTIEHSPILIHKHNKVAAEINESVEIICQMQAFPSPTFEWTFNSVTIGDNFISTTTLQNDIYQSVLKINTVTAAEFGEYICRASNTLGDYRTIIKLQKRSSPDTPKQLEAFNIGYNWILLQWKEGFNGGYLNTTFLVSAVLNSGVKKQFDCRTYNPCNITDLQSQTTYKFKVTAS